MIAATDSINAVLSGIFVDKFESDPNGDPGTIGFWKTNLAKLLGYKKGKPQISEPQMKEYIRKASKRCPKLFGRVKTLRAAYRIFNAKKQSMLNKARMQLYALLLNAASGKVLEDTDVQLDLFNYLKGEYPTKTVDDYPSTIGDAINLCCRYLRAKSNLEFAKDICDAINNDFK